MITNRSHADYLESQAKGRRKYKRLSEEAPAEEALKAFKTPAYKTDLKARQKIEEELIKKILEGGKS